VNVEKLLSEAADSESGAMRLNSLAKEAKETADSCVFLSMALHKFANDGNVSKAAMVSDGNDERYVYEQLYAAWAAINEARTRISNLHIAAMKEAGRDRLP
jgi:hypothetical protein